MATNTPYTYLIGWSRLGIWYFGVRWASGCSPADLWSTYFTSSVAVKKFRNLNGEPDVVEIRRVFTSADTARMWEFKLLRRMKVTNDPKWLNRSIGGPRFNAGRIQSVEERQKRSRAQLGSKRPPEAIEKTAASNRGRVRSEECRAKISAAHKGRIVSEEWRSKIGCANKGKVRSQEFKDQLVARQTGRKHNPEAIEKMKLAARNRKKKSTIAQGY